MTEHRSGPVRSAAAREAILSATARLLVDEGWDRLTIEGIARAAGVGKQTIYRWWASKGALVAECLLDGRFFAVEPAVGDTGELLRDLRDWLTPVLHFLNTTTGRSLLHSLVAAATEEAGVGAHLSDAFGADRLLADRLRAAVATGELPPGTPVDQLGHAVFGALIFEVLSKDEIDVPAFLDLVGFLLGPRPAAGEPETPGSPAEPA
ncbi:TetR/AcrR family transcriptional regulator [Herbiconiux sp. VKM Ac-1786]|uniref:TetR/AcrR family transcriptional regulator n=1 Tax=Herbiconiux sp. VKM Ac-1786 TaxID=2783824 RepID=UPI00188CBF99|nr:TetR/AcrR family transcriptional regulator [Herbiconiux sp. VKM Ac-1786]MBF4572696.1 TetR/AcrR family transcriptional regulator [Herbiconiux sp. VKM Ac-1786]